MDNLKYTEMVFNLEQLMQGNILTNKKIFLFGHCNATEELVELLHSYGFSIEAILDNNVAKHKTFYQEIPIGPPNMILLEQMENTVVLIAARAYASMERQLIRMGYKGEIYKLVEYNSFAEYSLSEDTISRMTLRMERGKVFLENIEKKYPKSFRIFCPFSALGDIYIMMSYLPYFLEMRDIKKCVVLVVGDSCAEVVKLFGEYQVEICSQKEMDEMIQAALYTEDKNSFIAHQDRPYVINLHKALYIKCIPLEQIYCCGVFGLPKGTPPIRPKNLKMYNNLEMIEKDNAVIFSPYAKSVTTLSKEFWKDIVNDYLQRGFQCFTNVVGDESPIEGTLPISPAISEVQSVVERAGHFVGIRSGLCDVIRYADCEKIALYPDYNYSDTKWKAIDMYALEAWKNIVVEEDFKWKKN